VITSAGQSFAGVIWVNGTGGTVQLADALVMTTAANQLQLQTGAFDCNDQNVTCTQIQLSFGGTAGTRSFSAGPGVTPNTITVTQPVTSWSTGLGPLNLSVNMGLSNLVFTDASATTKTLDASGFHYHKVTAPPNGQFNVHGLPLTFAGVSTDTWIDELIGVPGALISCRSFFTTPGDTHYIVDKMTMPGTSGSPITLNSNTPGAQVDIRSTSGDKAGCDWMQVQDMNLRGGARWFMGRHSASLGNNNGTRFTDPIRKNPGDIAA
jgi:hypothetical protein